MLQNDGLSVEMNKAKSSLELKKKFLGQMVHIRTHCSKEDELALMLKTEYTPETCVISIKCNVSHIYGKAIHSPQVICIKVFTMYNHVYCTRHFFLFSYTGTERIAQCWREFCSTI